MLDAKEALDSTAVRLLELLVALKRDSEELQAAYGHVKCYSGPNSSVCDLMPAFFCPLCAKCADEQRQAHSLTDRALRVCESFRPEAPGSLPAGSPCALALQPLTDHLSNVGSCSASCSSIVANNTNILSERFGSEFSETYQGYKASVSSALTEVGALLHDIRVSIDYAMIWLQLIRPPSADSAARESWSLPSGGQFLRVLLSRAAYPLALLRSPSELTFAGHLAVSSFWIFVPHVFGASAQGSGFVALRFVSYAPRLISFISLLRFFYSLSLYRRGIDAALLLVSIVCTALHSRHAFYGASGGRAHTYRPFEWAFSVYMNGLILTGFLGANLGEVATSGVIFMMLFMVSSANFVLQAASLKEYLQASVMLNTLVSSAPIAMAFYLGLEEWLRTCSAVDFLMNSSSALLVLKSSLPYVVRFASSVATGPSALVSWVEVSSAVAASQPEPATRADRDLQTAILASSAFVGGTALFLIRLTSSYVIGRESLCRWEKRRGCKPVPKEATEAYADHIAFVLLGMCPLFHRVCPGLNYSVIELVRELYSLGLRQSNAVMLTSNLLSLALSTSDFLAFLSLQFLAYIAYCAVVSYYGMAGAFLTSRGIDAELAQTAAAIDRLSVSDAEKRFLKTASQVRYGADAKRYCSAMPPTATPLSSVLSACFDWEGVFGHDADRMWDFEGLASGTLISNGSQSAVVTAEHCAISGPKPARLHGQSVHVFNALRHVPPGLGSDPARACAVTGVGGLQSAQGPLSARDPVVGEECLFVGARSLSWGKVASVSGMTAQTEQNPMPGYSGRLCVAASDFCVLGVVSMRTMWGEPRTGHISLIDVASVNEDAGFEVFRGPPGSSRSTSVPANTSLASHEARVDRFLQEVSSRPPRASSPRKICQYHLTGACKFGDQCHNTHLSREDCLKVQEHLQTAYGPEPTDDEWLPDDSAVGDEPEMDGALGELIRDLIKELRAKNTLEQTDVSLHTRSAQIPPEPPAAPLREVVSIREPPDDLLMTDAPPPGPPSSSSKKKKKKKDKRE